MVYSFDGQIIKNTPRKSKRIAGKALSVHWPEKAKEMEIEIVYKKLHT